MPRYNPNNKQHRKTLATRITKMLVAAGYSLDKTARSAEDVYRLDLTGVKVGTAYVRVSTSISKGEMRTVGTDAIRVYAVYTNNAGQSRGLVKTTNINRTGDMAAITGRLLAALRKTKSLAGKRANDEGFHALPVKSYKKKWVPKAKKAGSKRKTAKRINAAVKAAAKKPAPTHDFKVGDLILHSTMNHDNGENWKGMCKGVNDGSISVFWFHSGETSQWPARNLRPLMAA